MKTIGIFEAKTKLSEICEQVAQTLEPVTITRRGQPLVRIDPVQAQVMTIRERRDAYLAKQETQVTEHEPEFEVPPRSTERSEFEVDESP